MAKAPTIKFPRVHAGFYSVTRDGELVGYIARQGDAKETSWFVYNDNTPELAVEDLQMETAVDENDLFRVSKDFAREFFANATMPAVEAMEETEEAEEAEEAEVETLELQAPEWTEDETQEFMADMDAELADEAEELASV
jgi:hypothetical protein